MKVRDYVLFGTAAASIAANSEKHVTWDTNDNTYYEVESNECIELVELGVASVANLLKTYVRNKDNTDWQTYGFITAGTDARTNELPYANRRDWTKVLAPISPDVSIRRAPSLKMSTGDRFKVVVKAGSSAVSSDVEVVAVLRKRIAQNPKEQDIVEHWGEQFGGINSNAQYYTINGSISSTTANAWTDIISMDLLKSELYAFNKIGISPASHLDRARIYVDDQFEYNQYPCSTSRNMIPLVPDWTAITYDPTLTSETTTYGYVRREYIFANPLVIKKTSNMNLKVQVKDDGTAVSSTVWARLAGMRYKI